MVVTETSRTRCWIWTQRRRRESLESRHIPVCISRERARKDGIFLRSFKTHTWYTLFPFFPVLLPFPVRQSHFHPKYDLVIQIQHTQTHLVPCSRNKFYLPSSYWADALGVVCKIEIQIFSKTTTTDSPFPLNPPIFVHIIDGFSQPAGRPDLLPGQEKRQSRVYRSEKQGTQLTRGVGIGE